MSRIELYAKKNGKPGELLCTMKYPNRTAAQKAADALRLLIRRKNLPVPCHDDKAAIWAYPNAIVIGPKDQ